MKIATLPDFLIAVLLLLWWPGAGGFSDSLTLSLDEAVDYALDTFNQERNPSKARTILENVLETAPQNARAHLVLGAMFHMEHDYERAMSHYEVAQKVDGRNVDVQVRMGQWYSERGLLSKSLDSYNKALEIQPENRQAMHDRGLVLHYLGRLEEAEHVYQELINKGESENSQLHYDLGVTLQHQGKVQESAFEYQAALRANPKFSEAALNLAALHHRYGSIEDAIYHYQRALGILEQNIPLRLDLLIMLHSNLGQALTQAGNTTGALNHHFRVLTLLEGGEEDHDCGILRSEKEKSGSVKEKGGDLTNIEVEKERLTVISNIYRARKSVCDWEGWEGTIECLVKGGFGALLPFDTLGFPVSQAWRKGAAIYHSQQFQTLYSTGEFKASAVSDPRSPEGLKVGYICFDYNDHPTAHLVEGLFLWHARLHRKKPADSLDPTCVGTSKLTITAYNYGKDDKSDYRRAIEATVDKFQDLALLGNSEAVGLIRNQAPHILVDLQGHTFGTRMEIVAMRVAPIQVSYLIFPGTSGAPFIDYLVADHLVLPPEASVHYTEKLVYTPGCYQVNFYERHMPSAPPPYPPLFPSYGLPSAVTFVYCNFNKNDKLEPTIFSTWMHILLRVPGSVLWLLRPSQQKSRSSSSESSNIVMGNLRPYAESLGVDGRRLVFADRVSKYQHLERHKAADLFLDTFYYGAHSTATDAMRAGLPVLTIVGDAFPRRVCKSLLTHVGRGARVLMFESFTEYEDRAVWLGKNRGVVDKLKEEIKGGKGGLFNTEKFTWTMERGYEIMWEVHIATEGRRMHLVI